MIVLLQSGVLLGGLFSQHARSL